tara:strand:+ start:371 stop:1945 length:1575 start_codon:yes stop_codon:yes gene_type:complete
MARVVGSSFKPQQPARGNGNNESIWERQLASFVSPQGAYLLGQGLSALGKARNPFDSGGGLGLKEQAAKGRNAAVQVLNQAQTDARSSIKTAKTDVGQRELLERRDETTENLATNLPRFDGQHEGETPDAMKQRFESKPEVDRLSAAELRLLSDSPSKTSEENIRKDMEDALKALNSGTEQVENLPMMSDEDLLSFAADSRGYNQRFVDGSRAIFNRFSKQVDPLLIEQQMKTALGSRQNLNKGVLAELNRRAKDAQAAPRADFLQGETEAVQSLANMSPSEQRAAIREMAKNVKTEEDKKSVLGLTRRFEPSRNTIGDLFTSDDELRREFEDEVGGLIPKFDPNADLIRRGLVAQIGRDESTTELNLANAGQAAGKNETAIAVARINQQAKDAAARASNGKRDRDSLRKAEAAAIKSQVAAVDGVIKNLRANGNNAVAGALQARLMSRLEQANGKRFSAAILRSLLGDEDVVKAQAVSDQTIREGAEAKRRKMAASTTLIDQMTGKDLTDADKRAAARKEAGE